MFPNLSKFLKEIQDVRDTWCWSILAECILKNTYVWSHLLLLFACGLSGPGSATIIISSVTDYLLISFSPGSCWLKPIIILSQLLRIPSHSTNKLHWISDWTRWSHKLSISLFSNSKFFDGLWIKFSTHYH